MIYNKNRVRKINDKKVLHKIGKHWQVVSLALLMTIGGLSIASTHASAQNTSVENNQSSVHTASNLANQSSSHLIRNRINQNLKQNYNNQDKVNSTNQGRVNIANNTRAIQQQANTLHNRIIGNATMNEEINNNTQNNQSSTNSNSANNDKLKNFHQNYNLKSITPSSLSNQGSSSASQNKNYVSNYSSYVSNPTTNIKSHDNISSKIKKIQLNPNNNLTGQQLDHGLSYTYNPVLKSVTFHGTVNFDGASLLSGDNVPNEIKNAQAINFGTDVNVGTHQNMKNAFSGNKNVKTITFNSAFSHLTLPNFDSTSKLSRKQTGIDMSHMFQSDFNLKNVDLKDLDTREAQDMSYMFASDKSMSVFGNYDSDSANRSYRLTGMDFSDCLNADYQTPITRVSDYPNNLSSDNGFSTGELQDRTKSYNVHCTDHNSHSDTTKENYHYLNLETNFITNNVTNMSHMFANDNNLNFADLSGMNFNTNQVSDMSYMFFNDKFQNIGYPNANQLYSRRSQNNKNFWSVFKNSDNESDNNGENSYSSYTSINSDTNTLAKVPGTEYNNNTLLLGRVYSDNAPFEDQLLSDAANFSLLNYQSGFGLPTTTANITSDVSNQILTTLNDQRKIKVSKAFRGEASYSDTPGYKMNGGHAHLETGFHTDNVTNMSHMFANNKDVGSVDLHFDTDNLRDMSYMFENVGQDTIDSQGNSTNPFHQETSSQNDNINENIDLFNLGNQDSNRYEEGNIQNTSDSGIHPSDSDYIHSDFHLANVKNMEGTFKGLTIGGNDVYDVNDNSGDQNLVTFEKSIQQLHPNNHLQDTKSLFSNLYVTVAGSHIIPSFQKDLNNWDFSNVRTMNSMFRHIKQGENNENLNTNDFILPDNFNTQLVSDMSDMFADNSDINLVLSNNFDTLKAKGHMKDFYANSKTHNPGLKKLIIKDTNTIFDNNVSFDNKMFKDKSNDLDYIQAQRPIDYEDLSDGNSHVGTWDSIYGAKFNMRIKYPDGHYQYMSSDQIPDENGSDTDIYMYISSDLQNQGFQFTSSDLNKYNIGTYVGPTYDRNFNPVHSAKSITPSDEVEIYPIKDGLPDSYDATGTFAQSEEYQSDQQFPILTYTVDAEQDAQDRIDFQNLYQSSESNPVGTISFNQRYDTHQFKNGNTYYHSLQQSDVPKGWAVVDQQGRVVRNLSTVATPFNFTGQHNVVTVAPVFDGMTYSTSYANPSNTSWGAPTIVHFHSGTMQNGNRFYNSLLNSSDSDFRDAQVIKFDSDIDTSHVNNMDDAFVFHKNPNLAYSDLLNEVDFPKNFAPNVHSAKNMFRQSKIAHIKWNINFMKSLHNASHMFSDFSNINDLTLPKGFGKYISDASNMFHNASFSDIKLDSDFGKNLSNAKNMFNNSALDQPLYFPNGAYIANSSDMFSNLSNISQIHFGNTFGRLIANGNKMFANDHNLSSLTLPSDFGQQIISAKQMFKSDTGFNQIALPDNFNTNSANDVSEMFANNPNLKSLTLPIDFNTLSNPNVTGLIANDKNLNQINANSSDINLDGSILNGSTDNHNPSNSWYQIANIYDGQSFTASDAINLDNNQNISQGTWVTKPNVLHITQPTLHFINQADGNLIASDNLSAKLGHNNYAGYVYTIKSSDIPTNYKLASNQSNKINISQSGKYVYKVNVIPSVPSGNITVDYVNESGKLLSQQMINCNEKYGQMINVLKNTTMPLKNDYQVDRHNFRSDYQVKQNSQLVTIPLVGKNNTGQNDNDNLINISLNQINKDSSITNMGSKQLHLTGQIGNYIDLNANQFVPNNDIVNNSKTSDYKLYLKDTGADNRHGVLYDSSDKNAVNNHTFNFYYSTAPSNTIGSINVVYRNLNNNQQIGSTKTITPNASDLGDKINVVVPSDNGVQIPQGYDLVPGQQTNYMVNHNTQTATIYLSPTTRHINTTSNNILNVNTVTTVRNADNSINTSYNADGFNHGVKRTIYHPQLIGNSDNTVLIKPQDFEFDTNNLQISDTNTPQRVLLTPNGISTHNINFNYNLYPSSRGRLSTNTIHYISSSDINQFSYDEIHDIDWQKNHSFVTTISNNGSNNDNFSDAPYRENVPTGYQFVKVYSTNGRLNGDGLHNFSNENQDEVIEVIPNASPIRLHYINSDGKVVKVNFLNGNTNNAIKTDGVHGYTSKFNQSIPDSVIDNNTNDLNAIGVPNGYHISQRHNNTAEIQNVKFSRQPQLINIYVARNQKQGKIKLIYLDKGHQIGNSDVLTGNIGQSVNVTNQAQGGLPIPAGYQLSNQHQDLIYSFTKRPHVVYLKLKSKQIYNLPLQVNEIIRLGNNRSTTSSKLINLSGLNNSIQTIKPSDYNPDSSKYDIDSTDSDQKVTVTPTAVNPKQVTFIYDAKDTNPADLDVHYIDEKTGQEVASKAFTDKIGKTVSSDKINVAPNGYRITTNVPSVVLSQPRQAINVYVSGKTVNNLKFNVKVIKEDDNGNLQSKIENVPVDINGNVGDLININPYGFNKSSFEDSDIKSINGNSTNSYQIPNNYHAVDSDADMTLRINSDGNLTPVNNIAYIYQQNNQFSNFATVNIHYITSDNISGDGKTYSMKLNNAKNATTYHEIDTESDKGIIGKDKFNLAPYLNDIPETLSQGYSLSTPLTVCNQNGSLIADNTNNIKNYQSNFSYNSNGFTNSTRDIYIKLRKHDNPIIL